MPLTIQATSELSSDDRAAFSALNSQVYSPADVANWAGRTLEWSPPEWRTIIWSEDRKLALAHAGMLVRRGRQNDSDVTIGGIGGVLTHPDHRRKGLARTAIDGCLDYFRKRQDVDFGLLVCEPSLIPLYERLGWRVFTGKLLVTQRQQPAEFTFNQPMTIGIKSTDTLTGVIDLMGPPW